MEHCIYKFFVPAVLGMCHGEFERSFVAMWKLAGTFDMVGISVGVHVVGEPAGNFSKSPMAIGWSSSWPLSSVEPPAIRSVT